MDCARIAADELAERYLLGGLADEEREAYEAHFFECERCFAELRALEMLRTDLERVTVSTPPERKPATRVRAWAPAIAATVVLGAGLALWSAKTSREEPPPDAPRDAALSQPSPQPAGPDRPTPADARVLELARVEPPQYIPLTLRARADDARVRFDEAMLAYARGDYAGAAAGLAEVAAAEPSNARARVFLGVSYLMRDRPQEAITVLQQAVALRDPAYQDDVQFFLAKALIRTGDLEAASRTLDALIRSDGPRTNEARVLRDALSSLRRP